MFGRVVRILFQVQGKSTRVLVALPSWDIETSQVFLLR